MEDQAGLSRALVVALALPAAAALAVHGGFFPRGQVAFAVLAAASCLACVALAGIAASELRSPPAGLLLALAGLAACSSLWTIAESEAALRWAAVIAGYAALALAAGVVADRLGAAPVAALLAALAVAAGLVGLYGAGARLEPLAQRLAGQWSPGGPFEYSPALALAQVGALPVLVLAACARTRRLWTVACGAGGLAVAGSVIALAGSRIELLLGVMCVTALVLWGCGVLEIERGPALGAAALAVTAGGIADSVAGGYVEPYVVSGDGARLLGLGAIVVTAPLLWVGQRRLLGAASGLGARHRALAWSAVLAPAGAALALAGATPDSGPQVEPVSGFSHGRVEQWQAAAETALDRPLAGAGAEAFLAASQEHQEPPPVRFAHNLPLESWAELGAAGALAMLALYGYAALLAWRRRAATAGWLLGPAVIAFLLANLFDWPWHVPASGALFAIALGALAATE